MQNLKVVKIFFYDHYGYGNYLFRKHRIDRGSLQKNTLVVPEVTYDVE